MGSMFSILQMVMQVSLLSLITSYSSSVQPPTLSSRSTWLILDLFSPRSQICKSSSRVLAMPPPEPPNVYAGLTTRGRPSSSITSRASSKVLTARLSGTGSPTFCMACLNRSRSSAS
ncbi:MAG: hypothetical protein A4E43_00228 [Methanosaeta sp. PtaB.Bin005]|nr:MAG: hypothetical protein A4E43_00228 [Methanosaeta sp. PtaB.Bin005]